MPTYNGNGLHYAFRRSHPSHQVHSSQPLTVARRRQNTRKARCQYCSVVPQPVQCSRSCWPCHVSPHTPVHISTLRHKAPHFPHGLGPLRVFRSLLLSRNTNICTHLLLASGLKSTQPGHAPRTQRTQLQWQTHTNGGTTPALLRDRRAGGRCAV